MGSGKEWLDLCSTERGANWNHLRILSLLSLVLPKLRKLVVASSLDAAWRLTLTCFSDAVAPSGEILRPNRTTFAWGVSAQIHQVIRVEQLIKIWPKTDYQTTHSVMVAFRNCALLGPRSRQHRLRSWICMIKATSSDLDFELITNQGSDPDSHKQTWPCVEPQVRFGCLEESLYLRLPNEPRPRAQFGSGHSRYTKVYQGYTLLLCRSLYPEDSDLWYNYLWSLYQLTPIRPWSWRVVALTLAVARGGAWFFWGCIPLGKWLFANVLTCIL